MGRSKLEHELTLVAEIDGLQVLPLVQIPEMQPASILRAQQHLGNEAVLESVWGSSPAGH